MKLLVAAKTALYVSLAVLFGFLSYLSWTVTREVKTLGQQASVVLSDTQTSVQSLNTTLAQVNQPCGDGKPCGVLADLAKTLGTIRGAAGQVEVAAYHENKNLDKLDAQEAQLFLDTHNALGSLNSSLVSANTAIAGIPALEQGARDEFGVLQKTTGDVDALVTSQDVSGTLHNFNVVTYNLGQTSSDFQTKFHSVLFPPPCKGHWCFVIKAWPYFKAGAEMAEPAYYWSQLLPR
jgi:hypothetical protein